MSDDITDTLQNAWKAETELSKHYEGKTGEQLDEYDELRLEAQEVLDWYIEKLFRDLSILAELMNLPLLARELRKNRKTWKKRSDDMQGHDDIFISVTLKSLHSYHDSLLPVASAGKLTGLQVFRNLLENTSKIITDQEIEPANEAQVRGAVFRVLQYAFHDAVREIPVAKIFKSYRPDLGVRSLMAAAEYKFAANETEMKKALDDIYTDMKGYSGHSDWRTFFAVIYTTDTIIHKEKVEAEFRAVGAEKNWEALILPGPGKRKKKPVQVGERE